MANPRRYFKELRFRQLRSLVALARKGSFSAVAKDFQISIPSVWQQVRALEHEFGIAMVRPSGKTVELTEDGRLLVEMAQPLVDRFERIRETFSERSQRIPRRITVATTSSLLLHELQAPLAALREQHPSIELTFLDRPSTIACKHLENGDADIAVIGKIDASLPPQIACTRLTYYPFVLVCPEDHPLAQSRQIRLPELIKHPLVMPGEGSNSHRHMQRVFDAAGLWQSARVVLTASTFDIVAGYVRMGFGVSITSVSPLLLKEAQSGHPSYRGIVFRDVSRLFGRESVIFARRINEIEPLHHRIFRETILRFFVGASRSPRRRVSQGG